MKKFVSSIFGFGNPKDFAVGLIFIVLGLITLGGGQIGIQVTPTSEVRWVTAFAALPSWFGWLFILFGLDSILGGRLIGAIIGFLSPLFNNIAESVVGKEILARILTKKESGTDKWISKTYDGVIDEEAMIDLVHIVELKMNSPESFEYFYRQCRDGLRHRGITSDMIDNVTEYLETA